MAKVVRPSDPPMNRSYHEWQGGPASANPHIPPHKLKERCK
jgi:hypothetical protein